MNERLPPPDFNARQYERPSQKWVCGKASCGQACRLGPDSRGHCRVKAECQPAFEMRPGETKGRYQCTRPAESGGPCPGGPLPDGSCCRPISKCVPVLSLRGKRTIFNIAAAIVTIGFLLVALGGPHRWAFISPGPLSRQHATFTFAHIAKEEDRGNCAVCHTAARSGMSTWLQTAASAESGPWRIRVLGGMASPGMTAIDRNCLNCHQGHSFHEPNVTDDRSCSLCHVEHHGPGPMRAPADAGCLSCHADADVLRAAREEAAKLPAAVFDYRPTRGRVVFQAPRPTNGYTRLIHGFATDHPEFQIIAQKLKDPDTLRFNHELHLGSSTVADLKGRKLVCGDCHLPDAGGVHFLKITYQQNCQACHALQFDFRNPGLLIPHGDAEHVRAFLRSLPQEYADYAATKPGMGGPSQVEAFATEQIARLRHDFGSGAELERRIFFDDARRGPVSASGGKEELGAAIFPGCAYCHEVTPSAAGAPQVTAPVMPDRWMIHGNFDHGKHLVSATGVEGKIQCAVCHDVEHSRQTSDVLLPSKQTCLACHSPRGGVSDSCSTCHGYHSVRKDSVANR